MARSFSGRRLRELRVAAQLSPAALALAVDRSVHSIDAYELGHVIPPLSVALTLSAALRCSLDDLLTEEAACVA